MQIPGQRNFVGWHTARGVGLAAVDEGSNPAMLASLIFGPLLAGNGVLLAQDHTDIKLAAMVVRALWDSGVPVNVLDLAPANVSAEELAAGPINFAAVDLSIQRTRRINEVLGVTDEKAGQRWLKALISMSDGSRPGEEGFLRLFVHPKTVAINTLRHGADLKMA